MGKPILEVKNLKTSFHSKNRMVRAVNGVSFSLERGKVLGIVGESGCGKSVTSLSIMKLLPTRGTEIGKDSSILLDGEELLGKTNSEMCKIRGNRIAMIFQDSLASLNPVMRIEQQMVETIMVHQHMAKHEAREKAVEMLRKVGIPSPEARLRNYPHQLSGGMRQRVMIAMALSCAPEILIADEPTTALDVTIQAQILELMLELRRDLDTSIILITHDLGVVAEMADDIMVMYAGAVVEQADVRGIFRRPLHPYTQGLLASIPRLDQPVDKLHMIKGTVPDLYNMPPGCAFADRCPFAQPVCREKMPELYPAEGHQVRCFRYAAQAEDRI